MKLRLTFGVVLLAVSLTAVAQQKGKLTTAPTLGFVNVKGASPVADSDAFHEEADLEKKLPGNPYVHDKRIMHEGVLMHEFMEGFKSSKECNGITFFMNSDKKPDFAVQITVMNHDDPGTQEWIWILSDNKKDTSGGIGNQSTGRLTARDVCLTLWEDVDPNHFKKPGGRIE